MRVSIIYAQMALIFGAFAEPTSLDDSYGIHLLNEKSELSKYQIDMLNYHNVHRWNHTSEPLEWSPKLENLARATANECRMKHDRVGQNMAGGAAAYTVGNTVSNQWYNGEVNNYHQYSVSVDDHDDDAVSTKSTGGESGHFTQVIWAGSKRLGCWTTDCRKSAFGLFLTVCNYEPAGNVIGRSQDNVHRPIGYPVLRP